MNNIKYSPEFKNDLSAAAEYISDTLKNRIAAVKLISEVKQQCESLQDFPEMGKVSIENLNSSSG